MRSSKVVVTLAAIAAMFGALATGLLAAKAFLGWVWTLPPRATSLFTIISLLVTAVLVGVALRLNSRRGKAP